jgi:hypothetical protein
MFKKVALMLFVSQFLLSPHFASCSDASDELPLKLGAPVHDYRLAADNFVEALIRLADEFQIPMGIQWVATPSANAKLTLFWKDATVKEVLEGIANTQPGYEVQIWNNIVHVSSTRILPQQNFLLLKVQSFKVQHEVVEIASRKLRELIKVTVVPPKPGPGGIGGSQATMVGEPTIDLRLSNASVEEILDSLTIGSTKKVWVVTFVDSYIPTASGFHRTANLLNSSIPDDEQPVWELFRWDDSIPSAGLAPR